MNTTESTCERPSGSEALPTVTPRLKEKERLSIIADFIKGQPRDGFTVTETDGHYRVKRNKPTDKRSALEMKRDRLMKKLEAVNTELNCDRPSGSDEST